MCNCAAWKTEHLIVSENDVFTCLVLISKDDSKLDLRLMALIGVAMEG